VFLFRRRAGRHIAGFVLIVHHQIGIVEPKPYPTRIASIARIGHEFETQYVTIKRNGHSHMGCLRS
jgi:hypothetical protein